MSRKRQRVPTDSEDEPIGVAPSPRTRAAARAATQSAASAASASDSALAAADDVNAQADNITASVMSQAAAAAAAAAFSSSVIHPNGGPTPQSSNGGASGARVPDTPGSNDTSAQANRRRVPAMYIQDKTRRHITFSKRKAGLLKKANELACLTGTEVLLLIASEAGTIYFHATDKFRPLVDSNEAKQRISDCLLASRRAAAAAAVAAANAAAAAMQQLEAEYPSQRGSEHRVPLPLPPPTTHQRPLVCKFVKMQPTDAEGLDHGPLLLGVASSTSSTSATQPASTIAHTPPLPARSQARSHMALSPNDRGTGAVHVPGAVSHTPSIFEPMRSGPRQHETQATPLNSSQDAMRESTGGPESLVSSPNVPQTNRSSSASKSQSQSQSTLQQYGRSQAAYQQPQQQYSSPLYLHPSQQQQQQQQQQLPPAFVGRSLSVPPLNESPIPRQDSAMFPLGSSNQQLPPLPYHQQLYPTNPNDASSGLGTRPVGLSPAAPLPTALDMLFSQSQAASMPTSMPQQPLPSSAFATSVLAQQQHYQQQQQQQQQPQYPQQQASAGPSSSKRRRVSYANPNPNPGYGDDPSLQPTFTAAGCPSDSTYAMYGQPQHQQQNATYYHQLDPQSRAGSVSYDASVASPTDLVSTTFSPGQCATVELGGVEEPPAHSSHRPFNGPASEATPSAVVGTAATAAAAYPMLPPLPNSTAAAAGASPAVTNEYLWFSAQGSTNPPSGTSMLADHHQAGALQQYQHHPQRQQQHRDEEHDGGHH